MIPILKIKDNDGNVREIPALKGSAGKSAYEIAVANGFEDTEEEWIESLKGDKGDKGETGPQGEKGDTGAEGASGAFYEEQWDFIGEYVVEEDVYTSTADTYYAMTFEGAYSKLYMSIEYDCVECALPNCGRINDKFMFYGQNYGKQNAGTTLNGCSIYIEKLPKAYLVICFADYSTYNNRSTPLMATYDVLTEPIKKIAFGSWAATIKAGTKYKIYGVKSYELSDHAPEVTPSDDHINALISSKINTLKSSLVEQTISDGTEIAKVGGTSIYIPTEELPSTSTYTLYTEDTIVYDADNLKTDLTFPLPDNFNNILIIIDRVSYSSYTDLKILVNNNLVFWIVSDSIINTFVDDVFICYSISDIMERINITGCKYGHQSTSLIPPCYIKRETVLGSNNTLTLTTNTSRTINADCHYKVYYN